MSMFEEEFSQERKNLVQIFRSADNDHSGFLTQEEIAKVMKVANHGREPSEEDVKRCMKMMDENGDNKISEEEFVNAMITFMNPCQSSFSALSPKSMRKRSTSENDDRQGNTKKEAISAAANFFKTIQSKPNAQGEQNIILQRTNTSFDDVLDVSNIYSATEKAKAFEEAITLLQSPDINSIQDRLYSGNRVQEMSALENLRTLLVLVEVFVSDEERIEMSSLFAQIFAGITYTPPRYLSNGELMGAILPRMLQLLSINSGGEESSALMLSANSSRDEGRELILTILRLLRFYIRGPRLLSNEQPESLWRVSDFHTKNVVEGLHIRGILRLFSDSKDADILAAVIDCYRVFAEEDKKALESVAFEFQNLVLRTFDIPNLTPSLMKSCASALAVLCGHTYSFEPLEMVSYLPERSAIIGKINAFIVQCAEVDFKMFPDIPSVINHFATATTYLFPHVSLAEIAPLFGNFTRILSKFIDQRSHFESAIFVIRTIGHCLADILSGENDQQGAFNRNVFDDKTLKFEDIIVNLLRLSDSSPALANVSFRLIHSFLDHNLFERIVGNETIIRELINAMRNCEINEAAVSLIFRCLERSECVHTLCQGGIVDALFDTMNRLKQQPSSISGLFGSALGPLYNIDLILIVTECLQRILNVQSKTKHSKLQLSVFRRDHIDIAKMLHRVLCEDLAAGNLSYDESLNRMSDEVFVLLKDIGARHDESFKEVTEEILRDWKSKLLEASVKFQEDLDSRAKSDDDVCSEVGCNHVVAHGALHCREHGGIPKHALRFVNSEGAVLVDVRLEPTWLSSIPILTKKTSGEDQSPKPNVSSPSGSRNRAPSKVFEGKDERILTVPRNIQSDDFHRAVIAIYKQSNLSIQNADRVNIDSTDRLFEVLCSQSPVVRLLKHSSEFGRNTLKAKDMALKEAGDALSASGLAIKQELFDDFYRYFEQHESKAEIDMELFMECATRELKISAVDARSIFRAFDVDGSGALSLTEISVGFAKILSGTVEDKLLMAFNAYDADKSGFLDRDELTKLFLAVSPAHIENKELLRRQAEINADMVLAEFKKTELSFDDFHEAVTKKNLVQVGFIWQSSTKFVRDEYAAGDRKSKPQPGPSQTFKCKKCQSVFTKQKELNHHLKSTGHGNPAPQHGVQGSPGGGKGGGGVKGGGGQGAHGSGAQGGQDVCYKFRRGECTRGDSCRYSHI